MLNKVSISKFLLNVFGQMVGAGGGLVAVQSVSTINKGASPFNFQSNELFSKFPRQQMAIKKNFFSCISAKYGMGYPPLIAKSKKWH